MKKFPHIITVLSLLSSPAFAADLFKIDVVPLVGTPPPEAHVSSSSALNLIESAVSNQAGPFSAFYNQEYSAQMTYLGTPHAITMVQVIGGPGFELFLDLNPIGYNTSFTGATADEVWAKVKDFFENDVDGAYSRFLKALSKQSTTALTDGNPNASTALAAKGVFATQGFTPSQNISFGDEADDISNPATRGRTASSTGGAGDDRNASAENGSGNSDGEASGGSGSGRPSFKTFGLGFNTGRFNAKVAGTTFSGQYTEVGFSWLNMDISENVRLEAPVSVNWLSLEGTDAYGLTQGFALPITIDSMDVVAPLNWRITPVAGIGARVSVDALSGAVMWYAGVVNSLDYRINRKLVVSVVNQLTTHQGLPVKYQNYSFDSGVDQWILKNGVRLTTPLARRVIGDVYLIDTQFLKDAAVDHFDSVGASVSWRASKKFNLSLATNYDFGDNFNAWSVGISSAWSW